MIFFNNNISFLINFCTENGIITIKFAGNKFYNLKICKKMEICMHMGKGVFV